MKLPRSYLSYSQMRLWLDNKDEYRKRYYMNQEMRPTKELLFGSEIAKGLESGSIMIPNLIQYPVKEEQIKANIGDVPVFAYIDTFDPEKTKFREYKTGRLKTNGAPRWTRIDVEQHMQLDIYSLLIKEKYGAVDDECHLDWIVTRPKKKTMTLFTGDVIETETNEMEMTGEVISFPRVISQNERDRMKYLIQSIAREIEQDYTDFLKTITPVDVTGIAPA